jgi:hypothetical protein
MRADEETKERKRKRQVHRQFQQNGLPSGRQFPPVVRPRFRGLLRFAAAEDCSEFAVVGDPVSPPPPLRFSVAFACEGVDVPTEAGAVGLGAWACCGVPFALPGDNAGVDGALCGIVAGGI